MQTAHEPPARLVYKVHEVAQGQGITSPAALARRAQIGRSTAERWWKGQITVINLRVLAQLCGALRCQPGDLIHVVFARKHMLPALGAEPAAGGQG